MFRLKTPNMTAYKNLKLVCKIKGIDDSKINEKRLDSAIEKLSKGDSFTKALIES